MQAFPWNSALHSNCVAFFSYALSCEDSEFLLYFFEDLRIQDVVAASVRKGRQMQVGYVGALMQIAERVQNCGENERVRSVLGKDPEWSDFVTEVLSPLLLQSTLFEKLQSWCVCSKEDRTYKLHNTATTSFSIGRSTRGLVIQRDLDRSVKHLLQSHLGLCGALHIAICLNARSELLALRDGNRFSVLLRQLLHGLRIVAEIRLQAN